MYSNKSSSSSWDKTAEKGDCHPVPAGGLQDCEVFLVRGKLRCCSTTQRQDCMLESRNQVRNLSWRDFFFAFWKLNLGYLVFVKLLSIMHSTGFVLSIYCYFSLFIEIIYVFPKLQLVTFSVVPKSRYSFSNGWRKPEKLKSKIGWLLMTISLFVLRPPMRAASSRSCAKGRVWSKYRQRCIRAHRG